MHESIPEVVSVPLQLIETGCVYQPSWSAGRAAVTVARGGVESYRSPKERELPLLFPATSVQPPDLDAFASSGAA